MPLNYSQLPYLRAAGFKGDALRKAWAISQRESGGRPDAFNGNAGTGDQSYGLFQINMLGNLGPARRRQYGLKSNEDLLDPATNARVAYQMSKGGTDFGAWAIGPNAYKGAPPDALTKFKQYYAQYAPPGGSVAAPNEHRRMQQADTSENRKLAAMSLLQSVLQRNQKSGATNANIMGLFSALQRKMTGSKGERQMTAPESSIDYAGPQGQLVTSKGWRGSHVTDGLDWNNGSKTAADIMGKPGTTVGAPEAGTIVRWGSAQGGQALYFKGDSGQMYWMGHIDGRLPVGTRVGKDQPISKISSDHKTPHLHIDKLNS